MNDNHYMKNINKLIFSEPSVSFLSKEMFIKIQEFESYLLDKFGDNAAFFDNAVNFLLQDKSKSEFVGVDLPTFSQIRDSFWKRFSSFLLVNGYNNCAVFDYSYELFNYFCSYYFGGLVSLFKDRAPEWEGPRIYLKHRICSDSQLTDLPEKIVVYRGMCEVEYYSFSYGMSWSIDKNVAERFANNNTQSGNRSLVIQSSVNKADVLYFDPTDKEQEIVVKNGLIISGIKT